MQVPKPIWSSPWAWPRMVTVSPSPRNVRVVPSGSVWGRFIDIAAGKIDAVVVYKIDRLTRSLLDFAKIVEIFEKRNVSFVSVTQQFNTTTSMGRLTLNVLLSFAQFEREVTGERIRDKIAASKRKGMWMGGQPPLGYDVKDRKLASPCADLKARTYAAITQRSISAFRLD